ncbi:winged helix-turn-helix transcriptional regulator [Streptomyces sp. NPDC003753]
MLTFTLRAGGRDGIVTRRVHATTPPAAEYALTDVGHDLQRVLHTLTTGRRSHADAIRTARIAMTGRASPERRISDGTGTRNGP